MYSEILVLNLTMSTTTVRLHFASLNRTRFTLKFKVLSVLPAQFFFMNGENFTYYNVIESMVITGTASPSNLGAVMRFRTTREFLLDALSGAFDYSELKNNYTSYNILDTVYVIRKQNEEGTLEYHFKPEKNLIHLFRQYDNSGEKIVEISYDKYKRIDDCYFPSVIDMRNLKTNQRILLELSDIKLNIQEFSYNLVYPKNVKIIKWD